MVKVFASGLSASNVISIFCRSANSNLFTLSLLCIIFREEKDTNKANLTDYVKRYATEEALKEQEAAQAESSDSESSMSDFSEDEAQDMEL